MIIKSCPFCGGEAKYHMFSGTIGYTWNEHVIQCSRCDVTMRDTSETCLSRRQEDEYIARTRKELIERWNTRK